jgi:hypothetical protein
MSDQGFPKIRNIVGGKEVDPRRRRLDRDVRSLSQPAMGLDPALRAGVDLRVSADQIGVDRFADKVANPFILR